MPGGPPARIVDAWLEERFELVTGAAQLEELVRVTRYPKIRVRIERSDAGRLLNKLRSLSVQVRPHRVFAVPTLMTTCCWDSVRRQEPTTW